MFHVKFVWLESSFYAPIEINLCVLRLGNDF